MPPWRSLQQSKPKKPKQEPPPCPVCYARCEWVGERWECAKHGEPKKP